ncbi:MAG: S-layer homology domain-containing protein [Bacillota bacterium]
MSARYSSITITIIAFLVLSSFLCGPAHAASPEVLATPFEDVSRDHPYRDDFALLEVLGIFQGYGDGTVGPDNALTRSEFAKVAVAMLDRTYLVDSLSDLQPEFTDGGSVAPVWWGWINAAEYLGLIRGFGDGSFRADSPLTFAEATAVLLRAAGYERQLEDLSYPRGYIEEARSLGISGGVNLASDVPITRGEMARLVVNTMTINPPVSDALPADGRNNESRESLLQRRQERVEGTVVSLSDRQIQVGGTDYRLAPEIYLSGVDEIGELEGRRIIGYRDSEDDLAFIRAVRGSYEVDGILLGANLAGGNLQVGDFRFATIPADDDDGGTSWTVNGEERIPPQSLLDAMVVAGDVAASVEAFNGRAESISLRYWDAGVFSIVDQPRTIGDGWSVTVARTENGQSVERTLNLPRDFGGIVEGQNAPESADDLHPGDTISIATRGARGLGDDDPIPAGRIHRLDWARNLVSGDVESVEVGEEEGSLLLTFNLEDGETVRLREDRYLGGPQDMSINDLRHASWVSFAVDDSGYARRGLDAYVSGTGARYVQLIALGELGGEYYIVVDQGGIPVTYQLAFPAMWVQFADEDLDFLEGRFAELEVNASGKVEGVRAWVDVEPCPRAYMVVSVDAERDVVSLRHYNGVADEGGSTDDDGALTLIEAHEPAVYSDEDTHIGIEALSPGRRVSVYFSERDEPALIRPN